MARCRGWVRKEGRRCEREAGGNLFCDSHRALMRTFATGAVVAISLNYVAAQIPPLWSSPPDPQLTSADFQIRLEVMEWRYSLNPNFVKPELIQVWANLGPVSIKSDMEAAARPASLPSKGGPWTTHVYQNKTSYIENLASLKGTGDLVGQQMFVSVPYRLFSPAEDSRVKYRLEFYVRGQKIKVQLDSKGSFDGPITKEMFGIL
jgi:hypothetical protein